MEFDPSTNSALVYAPGPHTLNRLNVNLGSIEEMQWDVPETLDDARSLGRATERLGRVPDRDSRGTDGEITSTIYRADGDSYVAVHTGQFDASPVWEDQIVVYENGVLNVLDAMGVESTHELNSARRMFVRCVERRRHLHRDLPHEPRPDGQRLLGESCQRRDGPVVGRC